jgi:uncharacterized RDD family membrane protein YckC
LSATSNPDALLDTRTSIETPEHVVLSYHLAGPIRRGLAWLIDTAIRGLILIVVGLVIGLSTIFTGGGLGLKSGLMLLLVFLLEWGYFVGSEMLMSGRSLGKKALGLRVVSMHGLPVGLGDSILRNLLRAADFLPVGYVPGMLCMLFDSKFRRLGDLRDPPRLSPPPSEAELQWLPRHVDLSAGEREAIELFMRRAGELPPLRADELADILAEPLSNRMRLRYKHPTRFLGLLYHCHIQGSR